MAGRTCQRRLTCLRWRGPTPPTATAARGRRWGRHGALGTCTTKSTDRLVSRRLPASFSPRHRHSCRVPRCALPTRAQLPEKGRCFRRTWSSGIHSVGPTPRLHQRSPRFRAGGTFFTALGGAPPITATLSHGSASGRCHSPPTGGTDQGLSAPGRKKTPTSLGAHLRSVGLIPYWTAVSREIWGV